MRNFAFLFLLLLGYCLNAQVGIGTTTPEPSALLDVSADNLPTDAKKGFMPPTMTQAERDDITSPAVGLMVFNTTTNRPNFWSGTEWLNFNGSTAETLAIGDNYQGGVIGYILQPGDVGYVEGETHGIIVAPSSFISRWYLNGFPFGIYSTHIGSGFQNTNTVPVVLDVYNVNADPYAFGICISYASGGYSDWYLPSLGELIQLYNNRVAIGGFSNIWHWSSSQNSSNTGAAYAVNFADGSTSFFGVSNPTFGVRPVRSF